VSFISGFCVYPDKRGKGYGREILAITINEALKNKPENYIQLEVACENERALSLYKSCGFKEYTIYDYYEIVLV
jgi:ribosomal protein S18 acetylase RimI-like enzyme